MTRQEALNWLRQRINAMTLPELAVMQGWVDRTPEETPMGVSSNGNFYYEGDLEDGTV